MRRVRRGAGAWGRAVPLLQLAPRDLPVGGARQVGEEYHVLGDHVALEPTLAVPLYVARVQLRAGLQHDERLDRLAEQLVLDADHRRFAHPAELGDGRLDLLGADLLAARL